MDIKTATERIREINHSISAMIEDFEHQSGLTVQSIDLNRLSKIGAKDDVRITVRAEIR